MTAQILKMRRPSTGRMECSSCGATADAACNCGVPYVPAGQRAKEAVKANPGKSDRAIAKEIKVSAPTVGKARREVQTTVKDFTVEARTGLDGKTRKVPVKAVARQEERAANIKQINGFIRSMQSYSDFVADFEEWFETHPEIEEAALDGLLRTFGISDDSHKRLARLMKQI